jgi:hypothetical protein
MKTYTLILFLLLKVLYSNAQGNYNPFNPSGSGQYGSALQTQQPQNYNIGQTTKNNNTNNELQSILQEENLKQKQQQQNIQQINPQALLFTNALQTLTNMLTGKQKLSVADAYYIIENTYGNNYITKKEYDNNFTKSVAFIKAWMKQNKLNIKNSSHVNNAIQKFMSEKLFVTVTYGTIETGFSTKTETHLPFFYDYNDYDAEKDHRSSFVTKIMATGGGQCASMPIVYISIAQQLGIKAYLSYAPNHSYVKYMNSDGIIENYEPTSNWKINDNWYADNMFINEDAIKSGIYLDTLNYKQIVADCVLQLADFYGRKFGIQDGTFIQNCIDVASIYFPKNNNIELCNLRMQLIKVKLADVVNYTRHKYKKPQLDDEYIIANVPKAKQLFEQLVAIEEHKRQLGYDEQPKGMYEEMMKQQEFGGVRQNLYGIDGTQKQNLFQISK